MAKKLHTKISLPYPYDQKRAAVLDRSPYGGQTALSDLYLGTGFASVSQQQRGTFLSGGKFDIWRQEGSDAHDTVEWIVNQPWSNGEVFTVGISADGIGESVIALTKSNPNLKGQWWGWTTGDAHDFIYPAGVYRQDLLEGYMTAMSLPTHTASQFRVIPEVRAHENWSDWYANITYCHDPTQPDSPSCHYKNVKWPTVHTVGWFDIFRQTHLQAFTRLRALSDESVRDEHVLIVAPLGHCSLIPGSPDILYAADNASLAVSFELTNEMYSGLSNGPVRSRLGRVNLFIMGAFDHPTAGNYWTSLDDFPVSSALTYYLHTDGSLASSPQVEASTITYKYDPSNPTPMLGGNNLPGIGKTPGCGPYNQAARENRSDVATWDTEAFASDMPIVGTITAALFVSSDAKDTDFVVTISDVSPDGTSMLLSHGATRMRWRSGDEIESAELVDGQVYAIEVATDPTAYIFPQGHRARITVASAAAPYYNPNSNTGKFLDAASVVATNSVHIADNYASRVIFPHVEIGDIPENPHFAAPPLSIVDTAAATPQLSTLVDSLVQADLVDALSGPGPFTVFAPTNDAFDAISSVVAGLTKEQLAQVLEYHVISGLVASHALYDHEVLLPLLTPHSLGVDLEEGPVRIVGENNAVTVTMADVVCSNGIVHIVDAVLVPNLSLDQAFTV